MPGLQALLGYGLTLSLAYFWTRAIVAVEVAQGEQAASGLGLMLLLIVGPLTVLYLVLYTVFFLPRFPRYLPPVLALTQTLGTGWAYLIFAYAVRDTGQTFLLAGTLSSFIGTVVLFLLALQRVRRSTPAVK